MLKQGGKKIAKLQVPKAWAGPVQKTQKTKLDEDVKSGSTIRREYQEPLRAAASVTDIA